MNGIVIINVGLYSGLMPTVYYAKRKKSKKRRKKSEKQRAARVSINSDWRSKSYGKLA
jgi:hypothetical protein